VYRGNSSDGLVVGRIAGFDDLAAALAPLSIDAHATVHSFLYPEGLKEAGMLRKLPAACSISSPTQQRRSELP